MTPTVLGRLLIVDDESDLLAALCRILRAEGYTATGVTSASEAIATIREAAAAPGVGFDVLITDLTMPVTDGISLLRAAQEIDTNLVSIVMTGHGTIDTAVQAMKAGALDYILKPFNLSVISPVLSRACTVRRLRWENSVLQKQVARHSAEVELANRELRAANKELEAFTHSVSHDLRQPLNGVIGFAEFLLSEKPGSLNAKQKECLGEIYKGGRQLVSLTTDLLRFSRLGQYPIEKISVNVASMVREIALEMEKVEPRRNIELRIGNLPDAVADPSLLKQVFLNLLSNAYKFTRNEPTPVIEVTGQRTATECTYSIRDNGVGFDVTHAQRLFGIFQRFHNDRDFEGTGVGLSIVRRIVERHDGTISAQAAIGKGATFTIAFPA
jgi:signal transduction histidine kinase